MQFHRRLWASKKLRLRVVVCITLSLQLLMPVLFSISLAEKPSSRHRLFHQSLTMQAETPAVPLPPASPMYGDVYAGETTYIPQSCLATSSDPLLPTSSMYGDGYARKSTYLTQRTLDFDGPNDAEAGKGKCIHCSCTSYEESMIVPNHCAGDQGTCGHFKSAHTKD